jgi:V8-like Glu-specific endopeptidase
VKRHLSSAVLLLCLTACGGESPTTDSAESDIVDGNRATKYTYAALVDAQLDNGVGECSGAVIAPRVVLTAGHCVHGFSEWIVTAPYAAAQRVVASDAEVFDWETPSEEPSPEMHDVGLLYLDTPIDLDRYPTLADDGDAEGEKVRYVGRVLDDESSQTDLYYGKKVRATDGTRVGWPFTYATKKYAEEGDSGGPVVRSNDNWHIVGVASGGNWDLDIELLARVDLVHAWIAERVDAHAE